MARWIDFVKITAPITRKTSIFHVFTKDGTILGEVKWYGSWRQYSFFPADNIIFERICLREIADFCDIETRKHVGVLKRRKNQSLHPAEYKP